jgi:hypothetical protein
MRRITGWNFVVYLIHLPKLSFIAPEVQNLPVCASARWGKFFVSGEIFGPCLRTAMFCHSSNRGNFLENFHVGANWIVLTADSAPLGSSII